MSGPRKGHRKPVLFQVVGQPLPARLVGVHSYIAGEDDERPGARVWEPAAMRIVHAQRARTLRRRGEEVVDTDSRTRAGRKISMWFVWTDTDLPGRETDYLG